VSVSKREWISSGEVHTAWVVRYRDAEGKQRQGGTYALKRDAKARELEINGQLDKGIHRPDRTSITVREAAALWIDRCEGEKLETETIGGYKSIITRRIEAATCPSGVPNGWPGKLGDVKLSKLTAPMFVAFRRQVVKLPVRKRRGIIEGSTISQGTAKLILTIFKAILKEAQACGLLVVNPADASKGRRTKQNDRDKPPIRIGHEIPDKPDIRAIIAASTGVWRVMAITAAFTGMRASELRGLPWDNVDLNGHVIHVWQRADARRKIGPCKTGSGYRDIPISDVVVDTLREWKKICPDGQLDLAFPRWDGQILWHPHIVNQWWSPTQISIGMVGTHPDGTEKHKYRFHGLRHFYASLMIEKGIAPMRLQALLGHSKIEITMNIYGHLFPMKEDEAAQIHSAVEAVLEPAG
jgi:integrase